MSKDKIKKLFEVMSPEEQSAVILELNNSKKELIVNTDEISAFAQRHQKEYGKDISFSVKILRLSEVQAILHTVFGDFKAIGSNKKIAKINAIKLANETWN